MASWLCLSTGHASLPRAALALLVISKAISTTPEVLTRREIPLQLAVDVTSTARTSAHSHDDSRQSSTDALETDESHGQLSAMVTDSRGESLPVVGLVGLHRQGQFQHNSTEADASHAGEFLDRSTGRYSFTYDNVSFIRIGGGICRMGNCSCYPFWRSYKAGTKLEAQFECQRQRNCIAFAVDATVHTPASYHLYFGDDGFGERPRSNNCTATTIDKADPCVPQFDCYKRKEYLPVVTDISKWLRLILALLFVICLMLLSLCYKRWKAKGGSLMDWRPSWQRQ